jgi:hypothetical protein
LLFLSNIWVVKDVYAALPALQSIISIDIRDRDRRPCNLL